jgi:hypothetical protein
MSKAPPETRALWQLVITGVVSFAVGTAGVLLLLGWVVWRFVAPESPWYEILHASIYAIIWSAIGGLGVAAGAVNAVSWLQYRSGMHRCHFCDRPLKRFGVVCDCTGARASREYP